MFFLTGCNIRFLLTIFGQEVGEDSNTGHSYSNSSLPQTQRNQPVVLPTIEIYSNYTFRDQENGSRVDQEAQRTHCVS